MQEEKASEKLREIEAIQKEPDESKPKLEQHQPAKEKKRKDEDQMPAKSGKPNKKELEPRSKNKQKEAEEKQRLDKRTREKEKKRQQDETEKRRQSMEENKRKAATEERKKQLDELDQQRKSKLLEAQRRETTKIQEQHREQQSRPATTMAPWSTAGIPTGPSLVEIEKLERQQRAEQMRMEQAMREQQEVIQAQQQAKENMLKWNASVKPTSVKSLAEIQAEEHAKLKAAEHEMAERQAVKSKKDQDVITGASFWNNSLQQGAWNTGKVWGSSPAQSNSTSSGGFWEEPTAKSSDKKSSNAANAGKTLAKSQTMGSITTNKTDKQQQMQSKVGNKSAGNVSQPQTFAAPTSSKRAGKDRNKEEHNIEKEFTNWCHKTLVYMKANVDGE